MGVIIKTDTTDIPITMIGEYAGECWGADTTDHEKNYNRGLSCIKANHGRTLEFPQIYMKITGYSARVVREFYTHIGGGPTRLQASTRYINYENFPYVIPDKIANDEEAVAIYEETMDNISDAAVALEKCCGIPREDAGMVLPLGMQSTFVVRTNLRNLIDMSHQRLCSRAYWEYRKLMKEIIEALAFYSDEWKMIVEDLNLFVPKCKVFGFCAEERSCNKNIPHSAAERDALISTALTLRNLSDGDTSVCLL